MPQKNDFEQLLPSIEAVDNNKVLIPYIPVGIYTQEAEDLAYWVKKDRSAFEGIGFDMRYIDTLPMRIGALSQSQSIWTGKMKGVEVAQAEWNEKAPAAYNLRDNVLSACRYAYRKHPELLNTVKLIAEGEGNADMIQDLNDLSVLGTDNPEPLKAIKFNMELLPEAAETSDEMRQLRAAANGESKEMKEEILMRNKAYTYLKEAVDEIRECGKYLFADQPERLKGYRSEYLRKRNAKRSSDEVSNQAVL